MEFESLVTGLCFLEAPRCDGRGVWFSDCALGGIRCLRPDGSVGEWLGERKNIGGMAINEDGCLLFSGPHGIGWLRPETGESGILLDVIDGRPLDGVNDMQPDGRGGLFFGTLDHAAIADSRPSGRSALYRLDARGRVTELCGGLAVANGIGLSPDGRRLYHNESMVGTHAYELRPDGGVGAGELLNADRDCDGLAVDREGCLWIACTGSGTIAVVAADGGLRRRIPVPGGHVTSVCFGGNDLRDLYVTTSSDGATEVVLKGAVPETRTGTLYRARVRVPGLVTAPTRFRLPTA